LSDAQSIAVGKDSNQILPLHLLLALLDQQGGSTRPLLSQMGVDVTRFREELDHLVNSLPKISNNLGDVQMSAELGRLLNLADKFAQEKGDQFISSELVLLAATDDNSDLGALLTKYGVRKDALGRVIDQVRGGEQVNDPNAEDTRQALDKYTVNLTERAEAGKLDPVIGRDSEIRRTVQVLQRRTKNNPVLIGV